MVGEKESTSSSSSGGGSNCSSGGSSTMYASIPHFTPLFSLQILIHAQFDYRGHVCMVFDKLGPSLFDFIKRNHYKVQTTQKQENKHNRQITALAVITIASGE